MDQNDPKAAAEKLVTDAKNDVSDLASASAGAASEAASSASSAAKDAAATALDNLQEVVKKIQAQLTDLAAYIKEGAGQASEVISDRGKQAVERVGEQVQESPVASLAIVGAVGFLLGFLSRRD